MRPPHYLKGSNSSSLGAVSSSSSLDPFEKEKKEDGVNKKTEWPASPRRPHHHARAVALGGVDRAE